MQKTKRNLYKIAAPKNGLTLKCCNLNGHFFCYQIIVELKIQFNSKTCNKEDITQKIQHVLIFPVKICFIIITFLWHWKWSRQKKINNFVSSSHDLSLDMIMIMMDVSYLFSVSLSLYVLPMIIYLIKLQQKISNCNCWS